MPYFVTALTHSTSGAKSVTCGFQPKGLRITASQRSTNNDNLVRESVGMSDGTNQVCTSQFYDGGTGGSGTNGVGPLKFIDRVVSVRDRSGGIVSEVAAAHVDTSVAPWTSTAVGYVVDIGNSSYQYQLDVWG